MCLEYFSYCTVETYAGLSDHLKARLAGLSAMGASVKVPGFGFAFLTTVF